MKLTRRDALALSAGAAAFVVAGPGLSQAFAAEGDFDSEVAKFAGGADIQEGAITLDAPEIAENGNTVPISVSIDSPMTADNYVKDVLILADGNPRPGVATFHFSPLSGDAVATTRMRLARTQNVAAVARMSDGTVYMAKKEVKVTIGGCGG
jgi:sulfur-oxidizing protein SoxY